MEQYKKIFKILSYLNNKNLFNQFLNISTSRRSFEHNNNEENNKMPQVPNADLCCRSGCDNCVWLTYILELENYLKTKEVDAMKIIEDNITDPSTKAFIKMEIKEFYKNKK